MAKEQDYGDTKSKWVGSSFGGFASPRALTNIAAVHHTKMPVANVDLASLNV